MSELHASNWSQTRGAGIRGLWCQLLERVGSWCQLPESVRVLAPNTETGLVCIPNITLGE